MVNSSTVFRRILIGVALASVLSCMVSCTKKKDVNQVTLDELMQIIDANVFDTTSVFFGNFSSYPSDISKLPIGLFTIYEPNDELLYQLQTYDRFDNITGSPEKDALADLAGENFVTFSIEKSALDGVSDIQPINLAVLHTLFLMGNDFFDESKQTKIIVSGGSCDNVDIKEKLSKFLQYTNTGVKYVSVADATAKAVLDSVDTAAGSFAVAMIGETETIKSSIYSAHLNQVAKEWGVANNVPLLSQSISDDETGIPMVDAAFIALLRNYRMSESTVPIKAVIVEPVLDDEQIAALHSIVNYYRSIISTGTNPYKALISEDVVFVNPYRCAATECYKVLRENNCLALSITQQIVSKFKYSSGFPNGF